jgi:hypothetical protein
MFAPNAFQKTRPTNYIDQIDGAPVLSMSYPRRRFGNV